MFNFKNIFKKEHWGLVTTLKFDITLTTSAHRGAVVSKSENGILYIHLYESDRGNRRYDLQASVDTKDTNMIDDYFKKSSLYQTKIYRWLQGRRDPSIPTYNQIPEEDTADALRGSIFK
jgi:hypothetical protein